MTQTTPSHSQAAEKQVFETWVKTVWRPDDGASLLDKEFPRFAFAAFKAGRELLAAEAGKYPWITWKGSRDSAECPISPEAVVDIRFRAGDEHFGVLAGEYSWRDTGEEDDVVAYRFRAALTSQQEVAAPRMIGASTFDDVFLALDRAHELSGAPHERINALIDEREAASRVPVASLASREQVNLAACGCGGALQLAVADAWENYERMGSVCEFEGQPMIYASTLEEIHDAAAHREQGVEAAGAVERKWPFDGEEIGPRMFLASNPGATHEQVTAPPGSKTQDDLANAGDSVRRVEELRGDLRDSLDRMKRGDASNFAPGSLALAQKAVEALASQPKAPAPVPVVQGEAVEAAAKLIYATWKDIPEYRPWQDRGNSLKQDEARRIASQILSATPANMAVGAGGDVGAIRGGVLSNVSLDSELLAALHRFNETCEDSQPYDVPADTMNRLSEIGLVRRTTGRRFELTELGGVFLATPTPKQAKDSSGSGGVPTDALDAFNANGLAWAVSKWQGEVANRPLMNVHRRSLDDTWRQVVSYFGGDTKKLLGPSHDDLLSSTVGRVG